jgi:hypothetical protein
VDREAPLPTRVDDGSSAYLRADGVLAEIDGSTLRYALNDALGSVRGLASDSGALVGTTSYEAFGKLRTQSRHKRRLWFHRRTRRSDWAHLLAGTGAGPGDRKDALSSACTALTLLLCHCRKTSSREVTSSEPWTRWRPKHSTDSLAGQRVVLESPPEATSATRTEATSRGSGASRPNTTGKPVPRKPQHPACSLIATRSYRELQMA